MADESPPRPARRRLEMPASGDHPSGRWEFNDPEVTPPPADPDAAREWYRVRGKVSELHVLIAAMAPSVDSLTRRVDQLEHKDAEMARSLVSVERTQAVQTSMLSTIERGISDLKSAREKDAADAKSARESDGTRFRHVLQILVAVAALASSIVAIVLANR